MFYIDECFYLNTQGSSRNGIEGRMLSSDPTNYSGSTRLFQIQGANMKNTVVQVRYQLSNFRMYHNHYILAVSAALFSGDCES